MIVFTDHVVVPAHVMVRFLDSESVFLNLETERYFGIDPTGTRMWQLLTGTANIEAAFQGLIGEFEVEPEILRADLVELLNKLVDNDLIQVLRSDVGTPATI